MDFESISSYLIINKGLYEKVKINEENAESIEKLLRQDRHNKNSYQFDSYCVDCQKDSTFKYYSQHDSLPSYNIHNRASEAINRIKSETPITLIYKCQRNESHMYSFIFYILEHEIIKIGQYPSVADIEIHSIEKYRKILSKDYRDFSKAIGLNSHGIGIGSFVYLRRIFENLIEDSYQLAIQDGKIDDDIFQKSRMGEKIKLLKDYLPDILVENREIYGILSKGIHELSEDECLDMFPKVKLAIELILDEKLAEKEKESKVQQLKQFVSETAAKLK